MQIRFQGENDLEQALHEIHRRACEYEGPLMHQFIELARISAPVEPDEPLREVERNMMVSRQMPSFWRSKSDLKKPCRC